ncbi:uncharacterized protein LOC134416469 isoform X1 [Melospiza melodia melodia]|uniref:uncharacterized protein LOC134416469 isoform X1 n=1 Tax=Melospiza melodia melodia TaxID=1914991 RepID=UPI002FD4AF3E
MRKALLVFLCQGKEQKKSFGAGHLEDSAIPRDIVTRGGTKLLLLLVPGSSESQAAECILPPVTGHIPSARFCPLHDLQEGTLPLTSASFLFPTELRLCRRLPGMRILPVLCALLLLALQGVTGLSPFGPSVQACERRGGFCSYRSCPQGIGRIGLCSDREFCCRMRWYP